MQDRLLYFPEKAAVSTMAVGGLRAWPSSTDFRGLLVEPSPPHTGRATFLLFHGNAGHAGHRSFYAEILTRLGLRVILAEYPGYGPRSGELGETSLVADAEQTIALAYRDFGGPLILAGESLGAGVAAAASARSRDKLTGLLLITPWNTLEAVARHHYPWLPVRWLLRDRYDSVGHLRGFTRPVLAVVAEQDAIIPKPLSVALYESLTATKQLRLVPVAGHNDWMEHVDASWWRDAIRFLLTEPK